MEDFKPSSYKIVGEHNNVQMKMPVYPGTQLKFVTAHVLATAEGPIQVESHYRIGQVVKGEIEYTTELVFRHFYGFTLPDFSEKKQAPGGKTRKIEKRRNCRVVVREKTNGNGRKYILVDIFPAEGRPESEFRFLSPGEEIENAVAVYDIPRSVQKVAIVPLPPPPVRE